MESKSLYGYLRDSTERMLQMVLKEKVLVEEENLQDYQRRRKDEKVRNWKEKIPATWRVCLVNFGCGWKGVLEMVQE